MSEAPGSGPPGTRTTLFEHALRLHGLTPDAPLARDGEPYPDEERRRRTPRPDYPHDGAQIGVGVAAVLDEYLTNPGSAPSQLAVTNRRVQARQKGLYRGARNGMI